MKIYLNNTRDIAKCKELKAEDIRVFLGILSMIDDDREMPPRGLISKRCGIRTGKVTQAMTLLIEKGFLDDFTLLVNSKYVGFQSTGKIGELPFLQSKLKELSRNKDIHLEMLRLLLFLWGDVRGLNKVYDVNITKIAERMSSDRPHLSKMSTRLKAMGFISSHVADTAMRGFTRNYMIIEPELCGVVRKR